MFQVFHFPLQKINLSSFAEPYFYAKTTLHFGLSNSVVAFQAADADSIYEIYGAILSGLLHYRISKKSG